MAEPLSEELKQRWKENILKQRQSKLSIAAWCRQNGITVHTFYYLFSYNQDGGLTTIRMAGQILNKEVVFRRRRPLKKIVMTQYRLVNNLTHKKFNDNSLFSECVIATTIIFLQLLLNPLNHSSNCDSMVSFAQDSFPFCLYNFCLMTCEIWTVCTCCDSCLLDIFQAG